MVPKVVTNPVLPQQVMPEPFVLPGESVVPILPGGVDPFAHAVPMLQPWPDEVLMDGGDRSLQSRVREVGEGWQVDGLDPEDTIAHFDTLDGQRVVEPSNRVLIYAPRFSAVRKIDGLGRTRFNTLTSRLGEEMGTVASKHTDFSSTTMQNLQPGRHQSNLQASGMENRTGGVVAEQTMQIRMFDGRLKTFENLRLVRSGIFDNREKGRLAIAMDRANSWGTALSAQSTVDKVLTMVANNVDEVLETVHIKAESNSQLRLVKLASTDVAKPGDYVDFTIRFDNIGALAIGNVTVLDNLTPRLDYVPGSAECSIPAKFVLTPNASGSNTLRWEIEQPLDAGTGGIIRFQCRVR